VTAISLDNLARCLEHLPGRQSLTSRRSSSEQSACRPYSVLLPVWFAMPVPLPEPRCASYRTLFTRTALAYPPRKRGRVGWGKPVLLCGTVPGVCPAEVIRTVCPMEPGLSPGHLSGDLPERPSAD